MKKSAVSIMLSSLLLSPFAMASEAPSFSFIEASFNKLSTDDSFESDDGFDADGYGFKASVAMGDNFFGQIDYLSTSGDVEGDSIDVDTLSYGVGFNGGLGDSSTWFVSYNLGSWDIDKDSVDVDTIAFGFRSNFGDSFELRAAITSNDVEGAERENGYDLGMSIGIGDDTALVIDHQTIAGDFDATRLKLGVQMRF